MKISTFLPKKNQNLPIENRLFEIALFVTVLFFLFWSVYSVFSSYTMIIKLIYWSSFGFYLGFYILYKAWDSFKVFASIYYSSLMGLLAFTWLPAGGLDGPIMYWFFLAYISGLLVLPIRIFLLFIVSSVIIVVAFSTLELTHPGIAPAYATTELRLWDLFIAAIISLSILGTSLLIFKRAYEADRRKLKELISELEMQKIKAESADKAKTQFLATISHEMRTPLNGVVGLTELIEKTDLNTDQREMVQNLSYSSRQLHSIISDVLDLTLIEDNKLIINKREIIIKDEITNIITIIDPKVIRKRGDVIIYYDHDHRIPTALLGDDIRFRQILINLINNAVKFTTNGTVRVKSKLDREEKGIAWISFFVKDTGVGIPVDQQDKVFNKFYKANSDAQIEGTGLGLSICKYLVEIMKGTIGFESVPGKGTEFYFRLPFEISTQSEIFSTETRNCDLSGLRILLAEDTPINQMVAKKMLSSLGVLHLEVAENGRIASEMALTGDYDFILMDIQMPVMNGIEASKLILGRKTHRPPTIIAVTANVMTTDLEQCREAGMKDFVSKPFQAETLKSVLCKFV